VKGEKPGVMGKVREKKIVRRREEVGLLEENDPRLVERDDALEKADLDKGGGRRSDTIDVPGDEGKGRGVVGRRGGGGAKSRKEVTGERHWKGHRKRR
jgi:hypothetical protein